MNATTPTTAVPAGTPATVPATVPERAALRPGDTVLVTGAAGVIGRVVVPTLAAAGYRVVATDRTPFDAPAAVATMVGDTRDAAFVGSALRAGGGPDAPAVDGVVHLAAIAAPGQVPDDETLTQNLQGAFCVLDGAGRAGVRVAVAASSFSAYGYPWAGRHLSPAYVPVDEAQEPVAVDAYALSKLFSEEVGAYATRRYGLPTTLLRMPFVGDGDRLRTWVETAHRDPEAIRQELWTWLDTRDAAGVVLAVLESGVVGHHVVNVAAPDTTSDVPTAELLARFHPASRVVRPLEGFASVIDTTAVRELFGFVPEHSWRGALDVVPTEGVSA
ncbi:NAD(P)-dependent oxidoreductase [Cellulosimicrobium terreum]|nr:NAD(P)-dependent oxidoreductase [Cellulosimicrobium terreum]